MKSFIFFLVVVFSLNVNAHTMSEDKIVDTYSEMEKQYKNFLRDTLSNRRQFESFVEGEFEPAVKAMKEDLDKKTCEKCISPYLRSLSLLEGSASESLTYGLMDIVRRHSDKVAKACKTLKVRDVKKLRIRFFTVFDYMKEEKNNSNEIASLKEILQPCINEN
ncbi:MAG: hypothetical protein JSU04_14385 [Bdellovibrionales bacterium]|nr:hypothetical protein [Bdellovibrionales bacterium]